MENMAVTFVLAVFAIAFMASLVTLVAGLFFLGSIAWKERSFSGVVVYVLSLVVFAGAFVVPVQVNSNSAMVFVGIMFFLLTASVVAMVWSFGEFGD